METRKMGFNIGVTSIITLLLALLLVTLAALSFSITKRQALFTQRITLHNEQYLQTDAKAQQMLSEIDNALAVSAPLPNGCIQNGNYIMFSIPVREQVRLQVRLEVLANSSNRYDIVEYNVINEFEWVPETQEEHLWGGD